MERSTALKTEILCGNDITGWGKTELGGGEGTVLGMDIALGRGCSTTGWGITAGGTRCQTATLGRDSMAALG